MQATKPVLFYYAGNMFQELSNFYRAPFTLDGVTWPTVEHYFQAQKTMNAHKRDEIRRLHSPAEAKRAGLKVHLRPDWEEVKEDVMRKALYAKFTQHPRLKHLLLDTGDAPLHEASPRDMYWGMKGKDRLGILLMELRDILRKETDKA